MTTSSSSHDEVAGQDAAHAITTPRLSGVPNWPKVSAGRPSRDVPDASAFGTHSCLTYCIHLITTGPAAYSGPGSGGASTPGEESAVAAGATPAGTPASTATRGRSPSGTHSPRTAATGPGSRKGSRRRPGAGKHKPGSQGSSLNHRARRGETPARPAGRHAPYRSGFCHSGMATHLLHRAVPAALLR